MMLKDKVSLITGGARGIGLVIASLFAKEGSNIAICDVDEENLKKAEEGLKTDGCQVIASKVDVTKFDQVQDFVQKVLDKFVRIDILINNAGIARDGLLVRMSESDWDSVMDVNLKGVFNFTKAVARPMIKERYGRIVNIASIIGIIGNAGQGNYAASKGGIIAFTKSAAKELASRNINVNAIAPGFIETEMTKKLPEELKKEILNLIPLGKFGSPRDVADLAIFLVGDNASYITGQVVQVDGGMVT